MIKYDKIWGLNLDTLAPKWSKFMFFGPTPPFSERFPIGSDPPKPAFFTQKRLRDREIYIETRVASPENL
jgi:hypothetical protein